MDSNRIKKELDEEEISIEYNDIFKHQIHPLRVPKIEPKVPRNNTIQLKEKVPQKAIKLGVKDSSNKNIQIQDTKTFVKPPTTSHKSEISSNVEKISDISTLRTFQQRNEKLPVSCNNVNNLQSHEKKPLDSIFEASASNSFNATPSYAKPVRPLPFSGARFVQAQNSVLQLLLKDIISLNNEKDVVDEKVLSREIASLRAKNNLPSVNAEVSMNVELEDSDCFEFSEDDSVNNDSKSSENYGKDSGYDNESHCSGSLEDDNTSEVQDESVSEERSLVVAEPEYIDLDNYFIKRRKLTASRGPLVGIKSLSKSTKVDNSSRLAYTICNKFLNTQKHSKNQTENGSGCIKNKPQLFDCVRNCKFFGTEDEFLNHKQEKHKSDKYRNSNKGTEKDKVNYPLICKKCKVQFLTTGSLDKHYKTNHNQQMACLFCDVVCDTLTEYNLHISRTHSKRDKRESSSDSDSLEIIEIEDSN